MDEPKLFQLVKQILERQKKQDKLMVDYLKQERDKIIRQNQINDRDK